MSTWDDVGGNPCPGDVVVLSGHVTALQTVADHGRDVEHRLRDLHAGMDAMRWVGDGSNNIASLVQQSLPDLVAFWSAHNDAAGALRTFATQLEDLQSQAAAALSDYSRAASDLANAKAADDDASSRHSAANRQVIAFDIALKELEAKRLVEVATHQPTTVTDHDISTTTSSRNYQARLRDEAGSDSNGAQTRISDAQQRISSAQKRIETLRDDARSDAKTAATAVLASVGIVRSSNPLVRGWDDVVGGVKDVGSFVGTYGDILLDSWDEVAGYVSLAGLLTSEIPVLGEILDVAGEAMSVVSFGGHLIKWACTDKTKASTAELALSGALLIPFSRGLKVLTKAKSAREFESIPGIVKRVVGVDDARTVKGALGPHGIGVGPFRYRVHVVPKLPSGSSELKQGVYWTLLGLKAGQKTVNDVKDRVENYQLIRDLTNHGDDHRSKSGRQ